MKKTWPLLLVLLVVCVPGMSTGQVVPTDPGRLIDYRKKQANDPGGETKPGSGTTYYFSTSGDDSRDCKSRESPCKSTARAIKVVQKPGDTGLFRRGDTWSDANFLVQSAPGNENARIVWGAYGSSTSPRPVFSISGGNSVNLRGRAYLHIDRLDFRKMQVVRQYDRTHHIRWTYVRFREAGNACVSVLGERDKTEAHDIVFENVMIDRCGLVGKNGEGFYFSESIPRLGKGGRDVLIKDCVVRDTLHEPFNLKSGTRRIIIDGCIVYDYNPAARSSKKDPGLYNARLSNDPKAGHVIKNSLFIANRGYGGSSDAVLFLPNSGVTAFNNLIWGNSMYCLRGNRGGRAYLNTCYNNKRGFLNPESLGGPQLSMDDLRCNIGTSSGNNISGENSLFVDAGSGDLRLHKQVKGCTLNGEMTDILGRERKGLWSFGAFQYMGDEPPEPPDPPDPPDPTSACAAQFGGVDGFTLCSETETTCSFNANAKGRSCEAICAEQGGTCQDAIDNIGATCQENPGSDDNCQSRRSTEVCVCAKTQEPEPPQKPKPVDVQWCECGCDDDTDVDFDEMRVGSLATVSVCTGGCAVCPDTGGVPLEKDTVIGPVLH